MIMKWLFNSKPWLLISCSKASALLINVERAIISGPFASKMCLIKNSKCACLLQSLTAQ